MLTLVELFAGIGGFSVGFERAGVKTVAAVEIDPAARRVFSRNFPDAVMFDDVKKVSGQDLLSTGFDPANGILTAGWPCQDISVAGRGGGLSGERSGLFAEIIRLLEETKPKWFVLENVPRLLSINNGRDMGTVVGALAECGYGVSWRVLDASGFGIPQRRRRIFIVGCLGDTGASSGQVLFEPESVSGDSPQSGKSESETTSETPSSLGISSGITTHTHLDASGRRETWVPDRRRGSSGRSLDCVNALTATGVGTCGADDNQAQAGHLIAFRHADFALREVDQLNGE